MTGACHFLTSTSDGTKQVLALCGYSLLLSPFVYLLYDFEGTYFNNGQQLSLPLNNPIGTQTEAIASADGLHYWLTNESFDHFGISQPAQLLSLDLSDYLTDYLRPDSTHTQGLPFAVEDNEVTDVHPNPTDGTVAIDLPDIERVEVVDTSGRLLLQSDENHTLNLRNLDAGTYLIRIVTHQGKVTIRKVVKQ